MIKNVKGILFDLDGTLTDYHESARSGLKAAWNYLYEIHPCLFEYFQKAYWQVIQEESRVTSALGIQYSAKKNRMIRFENVLKKMDIDADINLNEIADRYGQARAGGAKLFPNTRSVLEELHRKYRLGIITEGSYETQIEQIRVNSLQNLFFALIISGQTPYHKPDIRLYKYAIQKMELKADEIVMLGDRIDWDLKPAKKLGCYTVLIKNGNFDLDISSETVDDVVDTIVDFKNLMEGC